MPSVTRTTAIFCIITQAFAGVTFTSSDFRISLGKPVKLTWDTSDQNGDVTIRLVKISGDAPEPVDTITKSGVSKLPYLFLRQEGGKPINIE